MVKKKKKRKKSSDPSKNRKKDAHSHHSYSSYYWKSRPEQLGKKRKIKDLQPERKKLKCHYVQITFYIQKTLKIPLKNC